MSSEGSNGGRISVSEDKLRLLFAEFKLELLKELNAYATIVAVEKWQGEITGTLTDLSRRLRKVEDNQTGSIAVSRTTKWLIGLAVMFFSALIGAVLYMLAQGVHG